MPKTIIRCIKGLINWGEPIAFDYETNCLKPEYPGAEIVSCSICWGDKHVIAFPWTEKIAEAMDLLLKSPVRKIASNMKFEERWTKYVFGYPVQNWDWDTMLAAHVLNNSRGVTGLKFQSFVCLGQPNYERHIEHYLTPGRKQYLNRIREIPLKDLLIYNGMDSLLEMKLSQLQKKDFVAK
jgi:DNA polymerase I-like protein with 3'-5' exonuclease and polymerase domains